MVFSFKTIICWSWSSSSSGCQKGTQQQITVQTKIVNGQKVTTTTYGNIPFPVLSAVLPSGGPSGASAGSTFQQECLDAHNRYRVIHGCPKLELSRNLCNYAAEWAKYLASINSMTHRTNRKYGENLFMSSGSNVNGATAVKAWYDEIGQYNYSRPGFNSSTGYFTQVVWKSMTQVGFAIEKRGNTTWVVANYNPSGNVDWQFPQNVPQRKN